MRCSVRSLYCIFMFTAECFDYETFSTVTYRNSNTGPEYVCIVADLRAEIQCRSRAVRDVREDSDAIIFQLYSGVGELNMLDGGKWKSPFACLIQLGNDKFLLGYVESPLKPHS